AAGRPVSVTRAARWLCRLHPDSNDEEARELARAVLRETESAAQSAALRGMSPGSSRRPGGPRPRATRPATSFATRIRHRSAKLLHRRLDAILFEIHERRRHGAVRALGAG